jgi:hypothetical protein
MIDIHKFLKDAHYACFSVSDGLEVAIAQLNLEPAPESDSSDGSPSPQPKHRKARKKAAKDVWTFYELIDDKQCCKFCRYISTSLKLGMANISTERSILMGIILLPSSARRQLLGHFAIIYLTIILMHGSQAVPNWGLKFPHRKHLMLWKSIIGLKECLAQDLPGFHTLRKDL